MSKKRTVLLGTTSFSVEAGEAAVGARPATVAIAHVVGDADAIEGDPLPGFLHPAIAARRQLQPDRTGIAYEVGEDAP